MVSIYKATDNSNYHEYDNIFTLLRNVHVHFLFLEINKYLLSFQFRSYYYYIYREEKNITNKATNLLKDYFTSTSCHINLDNGSYRLSYSHLPTIKQSEIRVVSVRGKNKLGYEFDEIHIQYELYNNQNNTIEGNGTIMLNEIADTDSDIFSSFSLSNTNNHGTLSSKDIEQKIKKTQDHLRTCFRNWSNEVLKHIAAPNN